MFSRLLIAIALPGAIVPALAQPAPSSDGVAADDIVVTAQRRSERLQDVPIAVSAVGADAIEGLGAKGFEDIARTVPGLFFSPGALGQGGSPIIRGVSSQVGAATVGYYIDETPVQVRPQVFTGNADPKLFDIARVEVLRGPQGTLFGASSMGGTIRFITPQPSFDSLSGRAKVEAADTSGGEASFEAGAALGGPIADRLAFRASVYWRRDGGYVDRVSRADGAVIASNVDRNETFSGRMAVEFRPAETVRIQPSYFYQSSNRDELGLFQPSLGGIQTDFVTPQVGRDRFHLPSLLVEVAFGPATLTSITSYFDRRDEQLLDYSTVLPNFVFRRDVIPGFENYVAISDNATRQKVWAQETRLTSAGNGPFNWIVGGFWRRSEETFDQSVSDRSFDAVTRALLGVPASAIIGPSLPGDVVFAAVTRSTETQLAGFADVTWRLSPQFAATAGVRISRSELDYFRSANGPLNGGPSVAEGKQSETPVTPRFLLSWTPNRDLLIYGSAQRGFRVGGVNNSVPLARCAADIAALGGNPPPANYDSDSLWSYEAGVKAEPGGRATINASVYRIDWSDIQQLLQLPTCGFGFTANLGKARINGAELELGLRATDRISLGFVAAYADARFNGDVLSAPNPTTGQPTVIARDGDRVIGVPDLTMAANFEWRFPIASGMEGRLRADYQFVGESFRNLPPGRAGHTPATFRAEPYEVVSLRASLAVDDAWDVAVFAQNLFDAQPLIGASSNRSPFAQTVTGTTLRPRTIGASVQRRF
jgi:outer membrane receptor protein involved in Fe transport